MDTERTKHPLLWPFQEREILFGRDADELQLGRIQAPLCGRCTEGADFKARFSTNACQYEFLCHDWRIGVEERRVNVTGRYCAAACCSVLFCSVLCCAAACCSVPASLFQHFFEHRYRSGLLYFVDARCAVCSLVRDSWI